MGDKKSFRCYFGRNRKPLALGKLQQGVASPNPQRASSSRSIPSPARGGLHPLTHKEHPAAEASPPQPGGLHQTRSVPGALLTLLGVILEETESPWLLGHSGLSVNMGDPLAAELLKGREKNPLGVILEETESPWLLEYCGLSVNMGDPLAAELQKGRGKSFRC